MTEISRLDTPPDILGECPVWCTEDQLLFRVDIEGRRIHRYDPVTGQSDFRSVPGRPGSIALTDIPGLLLVAVETHLAWYNYLDDQFSPWIQLEPFESPNRLNDGRCDPAGRFVVGSMHTDTNSGQRTGILHQITADGDVRTIRDHIGVSNGLAFDSQQQIMYFADSHTAEVLAYDYNAETGDWANDRSFFDYKQVRGLPDGACLDTDGCYWSASAHGWQIVRITPHGKIDRVIKLPVQIPSMPAFGGTNLSTLFVTSIAAAPPPEQQVDPAFPPGSVLAIDLDVQGLPEPRFSAAAAPLALRTT